MLNLLPSRTGLFLGFFLLSVSAFSAKIDTVTTYSPSMQKDIKAVVITPEDYHRQQEYPVVYLLHGYSGNYQNWVMRVPALQQYADQYEMIIVTPDGNYGSWYLDSRSEEHTSELQSRPHLVCRLLLEKKKYTREP